MFKCLTICHVPVHELWAHLKFRISHRHQVNSGPRSQKTLSEIIVIRESDGHIFIHRNIKGRLLDLLGNSIGQSMQMNTVVMILQFAYAVRYMKLLTVQYRRDRVLRLHTGTPSLFVWLANKRSFAIFNGTDCEWIGGLVKDPAKRICFRTKWSVARRPEATSVRELWSLSEDAQNFFL